MEISPNISINRWCNKLWYFVTCGNLTNDTYGEYFEIFHRLIKNLEDTEKQTLARHEFMKL